MQAIKPKFQSVFEIGAIHNFLSMFFQKEIAIPLKTIAHSLVVYLRMQAIKPNFQSVFEIGAGGGILNFFISQNTALKNYSYTDISESYYVLQNLVNMYIYKDTFKQFALPQSNSPLLYSLDNKYQNNGYLYKHSLKILPKTTTMFCIYHGGKWHW